MKTLLTMMMLLACSVVCAQTDQDLLSRVQKMEAEVESINLRLEKYSTLNNSAGALFLAGAAGAAYHYTFGDEKTDLLIPSVATAAVGTAILYFTSNALRRKARK